MCACTQGVNKIKHRQEYQYCVYTQDSQFREVVKWVIAQGYEIDMHINRTRFWIPKGQKHTEFLLRWGSVCVNVDGEVDHAIGR